MDDKPKMQSRQRLTMPSGPNKISGFASKISKGQSSAKTDTPFDDSEEEELLSNEEESDGLDLSSDEEVPSYYLQCQLQFQKNDGREDLYFPDGSLNMGLKSRINKVLWNLANKKLADLANEKVANEFDKQLPDLSTESKLPQQESEESELSELEELSSEEEVSEDEEEGFDVARLHRPNFQRIFPLGGFAKNKKLLDRLNHLSRLSIDKFNEENKENYSVVEVLSVNCSPCAGRLYFITFHAQKSDTDVKDFQARVWDGIKKVEVTYCRPAVRNKVHAQVLEGKEKCIVEPMGLKKEYPGLNRNLYPEIEPYSSGFLKVSDLHSIYWEQSGNPNGHPVVFLHGGPGRGTSPNYRRFFDPEFYRIVLFDQRGAGRSTPRACLDENTTWDLIKDIEKLREHLEIPEWQVFGCSWGSTLSLAYSQSHPDKVTGIVLKGIFLLRKEEIHWFYEGGAAAISPYAWEPFRELIPEHERGCFVEAYHKRLKSDEKEVQIAAARAWMKWEMTTALNEENMERGDEDNFSLAFARIQNHYVVNKGFFPSDSYLLDNLGKIKHIPTVIVQGRWDLRCPMMSVWDLHKAWPEAEIKVVPSAEHSANEPGIAAELVAANEKLKNIIKEK